MMAAYLRENFWIITDAKPDVKASTIARLEKNGVVLGELRPRGPSNSFYNCKATSAGKIFMDKLFSEGFILYGHNT